MATLKQFMTQLSLNGLVNDRADLILGWTKGRTSSAKELTDDERSEIIQHLQRDDQKRQIKSNIIALAERTGIKVPGDWEKFNAWMLNRSKFKKHLNSHSLVELQILYKQMRALEQNHIRSAKKPFNKAWWRDQELLKNWN